MFTQTRSLRLALKWKFELLCCRTFRKNHLNVGVRTRNNVDGNEFPHTLRCCCAGIRGRFHCTDITAYHHGNVPTADDFFADERYAGGLYHCVSCFNRADEPKQ